MILTLCLIYVNIIRETKRSVLINKNTFDNKKQETKMKMVEENKVPNGPMVLGITVFLAIISLTLFVTGVLIEIPMEFSIPLSLVIASSIFYKKVLGNFLVIVPENKAWIISNAFKDEEVSENSLTETGYRNIKAQRELQAGIHFIYPWESKAEEIDMKWFNSIGSKEEDGGNSYTLKNGRTVKIAWQVRVVPLPGFLVNFNRSDKKDIERKVRARAEAFFQGYIGNLELVQFGNEQKKDIEKAFENLWGGESTKDDQEKELGVWTGTPEVFDISNPKDVEIQMNWEAIMLSTTTIAKRMVEESGNKMSFQDAMRLALIGQGKAKMEMVDVVGLLGGGGKKDQQQQQRQPKKGGK